MNEFVCDYHEEEIEGTIYYPQPRMSLENRRRFFVRGLDAGDRELGVFNAFGLAVCQIFTTVVEQYLRIPGDVLEKENIKVILNESILAPEVRENVSKTKRRAQVGGADGGVLGIIHRYGLDQPLLEKIWKSTLPKQNSKKNPLDIIQFGRYRVD
jgi:hypothetical protein